MVAIAYSQKLGMPRYYRHYLMIGTLAIIFIAGFVTFLPFILKKSSKVYHGGEIIQSLLSPPEVVLKSENLSKTNNTCHYYSCFNTYKCGKRGHDKILVYVYPHKMYFDEHRIPITNSVSKEFYEIIKTIVKSEYYTPNPEIACVFIPSVDTLNQNRLRLIPSAQVLSALPYWNDGENHLLFNFLPGSTPDYNASLDVPHGLAMLAGSGFSSSTYRYGYDISFPIFNPLAANKTLKPFSGKRKWQFVSSQFNLHEEYLSPLKNLASKYADKFLFLMSCSDMSIAKSNYRCDLNDKSYEYPNVLQVSEFCLVGRGARLSQPVLYDAMVAGCIPVIISDGYVLPFSEVIDWRRASLRFYEEEIGDVMEHLQSISQKRIKSMRSQLSFLFSSYFQSIPKITLTTLKILNERVFPYKASSYSNWNNPSHQQGVTNKLSLPLIAPQHEGFTAVILTYDRINSLYKVIKQISTVPSLSKILVIWNNQKRAPPSLASFPKIDTLLKVIRTPENKLSNRFYPYEEITTQAILSIDDDINMMTSDEIEFGYQVWREFPDRIVGFPSRVHVWDSSTKKWRYESEWTNQISMVLTGIAFYHKYYNHAYTSKMPGNIKSWVDEIMNCEDIAMNFLVSNITGKAPIKVAPRKKFKCPECSSSAMSADVGHMVERSNCINKFAEEYGHMPLKAVEYRADPVLFKERLPDKLKAFNDLGKL